MNLLIQFKKQLPYFEVLAAIIAVMILQACAATTTTTQCAKPTLTPPGVSGPVHSVTVRITTATGNVTFSIGHKTLKPIAYKAGWTDSLVAVGDYDYETGQ